MMGRGQVEIRRKSFRTVRDEAGRPGRRKMTMKIKGKGKRRGTLSP